MKKFFIQFRGNRTFWSRILVTIYFIFLALLHWFCNIDIIVIVLLIMALLPWLTKYVKKIDFPNVMGIELHDLGEAENKKVEFIDEKGDYLEIRFGKSISKILQAKDKQNLLFFKARINFDHEAGNQYLLRLRVNDELITINHLVNKPITKILNDGREYPWFNPKNDSWSLSYSPNFKENYLHFRYKIVNGDPYIFIINLSGIPKKENNKYEVIFEHNGMPGHESFKNSIIVRDYYIF